MPEMKIRSAPARAVLLGVVAGFRIVGKAQAHELAKYTRRLPASTGPGRHWTDGSIEFPPGDEVFLRGKQLKAGRRSPWDLGSQILFPDHELRKQLVNSRADGACGKLFFEQSFAGTITSASTVHSGHADLLRHPDPPFLRLPQGILIAEHDRRPHFLAEFQQTVVRISAQNKSDIPRREVLGNVQDAPRPENGSA